MIPHLWSYFVIVSQKSILCSYANLSCFSRLSHNVIVRQNGIILNMNIAEYRDVCQFHQWLELKKIRHTHIVNEQPNKQRAIAEKRMGKSKGFPDMLVFLNNGVNVAIEMKRNDKIAKATTEQIDWLKFLSTRGFKCAVCHGVSEAISFINECDSVDDNVEF